MNILSLHNSVESGAALLSGGRLVGAVTEERFTRQKNYAGFPKQSIDCVLKKENLNLSDIDIFAFGRFSGKGLSEQHCQKLLNKIQTFQPEYYLTAIDTIKRRLTAEFADCGLIEDIVSQLGQTGAKFVTIDHHHAHAWSAFTYSPFDEAFIATFDGRGDFKSGTFSTGNTKDGITENDFLLTLDSMGFLYSQVTEFLGYKPHRHEGKITGLAAFGNYQKSIKDFEKIINWDGETIRSNMAIYEPFSIAKSGHLREIFGQYSPEDLAAGVQKHLENVVTAYIKHAIKKADKPNIRHLCLAGGIFANVRLNQLLLELDEIDNVFVFPAMSDGGLTAGAAAAVHFQETGEAKIDFNTVSLGPRYSLEEIQSVVDSFDAKIKVVDIGDDVEPIVSSLVAGEVVGYFEGAMEYGPRALGNRSMLVHAQDKSINDWLNKRLKRTEFMPFAPVTPEHLAKKAYINWEPFHVASHYMTITYQCTPEFIENHPAVVHIDNTARPQITRQGVNGKYHRVVSQYCEQTGKTALVNTSFNRHEEPIVCSPADAIHALLDNTIDVLYLENLKITLT